MDGPALRVTPLVDRPILPPPQHESPEGHHPNINGPSLVRMPAWASAALGRYHLYFADHKGASIRLAYADALEGPWRVHEPGALRLADTPCLQQPPAIPAGIDAGSLRAPRAPDVPSPLDDCRIPHIASPDVVVDAASRSLRLYYHGLESFGYQPTRVAISSDGLHFEARPEILSPPYLRMFRYAETWYGLAMPGGVFRSESGVDGFEPGPVLFEPDMRHAGLWLCGDTLRVFWTRVGDAPERILLSTLHLRGDWMHWRASKPVEVHRPTRDWEGADQPAEASVRSAVGRRVNQLRDPYVYVEGGDAYLAYAVAGESGIALARLEEASR